MKRRVTVTLVFGAVPVLAAVAILVIIAPSVQTWIVVMGISVLAGLCSAYSGYERYRVLVSVAKRIDDGAQMAITALAETTAARADADKVLAASFERCFAGYGQREAQSRSGALTKFMKDVTTLLGQYRDIQDREAKSRTATVAAELVKVRETFADVGQAIENTVADWRTMTLEVERISKRLSAELRERVTGTLNALQDAWAHGAELRASEMVAEVRRTRAEFEQLTRAADETLREHAAVFKEHQQYVDAQLGRDAELRCKALADWAGLAKESSNSIRALISDLKNLLLAERRRQEEQKRAERDHFENILEDQRKAHEDAAVRSGQLWDHLLNRLKDDAG